MTNKKTTYTDATNTYASAADMMRKYADIVTEAEGKPADEDKNRANADREKKNKEIAKKAAKTKKKKVSESDSDDLRQERRDAEVEDLAGEKRDADKLAATWKGSQAARSNAQKEHEDKKKTTESTAPSLKSYESYLKEHATPLKTATGLFEAYETFLAEHCGHCDESLDEAGWSSAGASAGPTSDKPEFGHKSGCAYNYGHDCDCGKKTPVHASNCAYNYGHDCNCAMSRQKTSESKEISTSKGRRLYKESPITSDLSLTEQFENIESLMQNLTSKVRSDRK